MRRVTLVVVGLGALIASAPRGGDGVARAQQDDGARPLRTFEMGELRAVRAASGDPWHEFLAVPTMSAGLYVLEAGTDDDQQPHDRDEVYYVLSGRATVEVEDERRPVRPGSVIFVAARAAHRFVAIEERLELLVFFAGASSAD